jgi:hypothetical protein
MKSFHHEFPRVFDKVPFIALRMRPGKSVTDSTLLFELEVGFGARAIMISVADQDKVITLAWE